METFTNLFNSPLAFVYHSFDRIVIQGYRGSRVPSTCDLQADR